MLRKHQDLLKSHRLSAMNSAKHTFTFDLKNGDGSKLKKPTYDRTKTEIVKYIYPPPPFPFCGTYYLIFSLNKRINYEP